MMLNEKYHSEENRAIELHRVFSIFLKLRKFRDKRRPCESLLTHITHIASSHLNMLPWKTFGIAADLEAILNTHFSVFRCRGAPRFSNLLCDKVYVNCH